MKLSDEQYAELAASFTSEGSPIKTDQRRANRIDLRATIRITPIVPGEQTAPIDVIANDFSPRGIAILHSAAMNVGQQFITQLLRRSGGTVDILCTVVHCVPAGDLFRVGAEFNCTMPAPNFNIPAIDSPDAPLIRETIIR